MHIIGLGQYFERIKMHFVLEYFALIAKLKSLIASFE